MTSTHANTVSQTKNSSSFVSLDTTLRYSSSLTVGNVFQIFIQTMYENALPAKITGDLLVQLGCAPDQVPLA